MKEKIARISGIPDCAYVSPECPDDVAEEFLENVLAFEERPERPLYGSRWFPYFMRRLAERPANLLFIVRNLLKG